MNIYEKLANAREQFHALNLKKSGHNKFAGYSYFELSDFLIPAMKCLKDNGLIGIVSFDSDGACLRINEFNGDGVILITSPAADANLKGCHPIQNLGAVETYQRRYLWVTAMEIVEHDAVDSAEPVKPEKTAAPATEAQRSALVDYDQKGFVSKRRAAWLAVEKNWQGLTEAQAKTIINECKQLEQENAA